MFERKWKCNFCGYRWTSQEEPWRCPECGRNRTRITERKGFTKNFIVWNLCWICGILGCLAAVLEFIPAIIIGLVRDEFELFIAPWLHELPFRVERAME